MITTLIIFNCATFHVSTLLTGILLFVVYIIYVVSVVYKDKKDRRALEEEKKAEDLENALARKNSIEKDKFNSFDVGKRNTLLVRKSSNDMLTVSDPRRNTTNTSTQPGQTNVGPSILSDE